MSYRKSGKIPSAKAGTATDGKQELELVNPTLEANWPYEPRNDFHFAIWMKETEAALRLWLVESKERCTEATALDAERERRKSTTETSNNGDSIPQKFERTDNGKITRYTAEADAVWNNWESMTDLQTGTIFASGQQQEMNKAMLELRKRRETLHARLGTWRKFVEYRYAQAAWEDFLYYQNVWHRKEYRPGVQYGETPEEKAAITVRKDMEATAKMRAGPRRKAGNDPNEFPDEEDEPRKAEDVTDANDIQRPIEDKFSEPYYKWSNHLVRLYRHFKLGYRKRMPTLIGPDIAHRYSQPVRGTTPQHLARYRKRHQDLEERFPRMKRRVTDLTDIEESRRSLAQRRRDGTIGMVPIRWQVDDAAFNQAQNERLGNIQFQNDERTKRLLPQEHVLHHGCTETSFDWPTSFDSPRWGNTFLVTGREFGYLMQNTSGDKVETPQVPDSQPRKRIRIDKDGEPEGQVESKPRYEIETVPATGNVFTHDMNSDGTVRGRTRRGRWRGFKRLAKYEAPRFKLDEEGARIQADPEPMLKRTYYTWVDQVALKATRPEKHEQNNVMDQLSDDEDEACVQSNRNFGLSGNMNPDQVGNPTQRPEDNKFGDDNDGESGYEESDDDGDLFRQSYEQCS